MGLLELSIVGLLFIVAPITAAVLVNVISDNLFKTVAKWISRCVVGSFLITVGFVIVVLLADLGSRTTTSSRSSIRTATRTYTDGPVTEEWIYRSLSKETGIPVRTLKRDPKMRKVTRAIVANQKR